MSELIDGHRARQDVQGWLQRKPLPRKQEWLRAPLGCLEPAYRVLVAFSNRNESVSINTGLGAWLQRNDRLD